MRTCRNHPDREALYKTRMCRECFAKRQKDYRKRIGLKRQSTNTKKQIDDLNLNDLIKDAKNGWELKNLQRRYSSYSYEKICAILKNHNIPLRKEIGLRDMNKDGVSTQGVNLDLLDITYNVRAKHQVTRILL